MIFRLSVGKVLSHSANKLRGRTFQVFGKVRVSKNFVQKKEKTLSCVETFSRLTVPKKTVGQPLKVSENFGYWRFLCIRKGISQFSVETNLLHRNEKLRRWSLLFFKKFLIGKKLCIRDKGRGGRLSRFCVEKILSHSAKKFVGELFIVSEK